MVPPTYWQASIWMVSLGIIVQLWARTPAVAKTMRMAEAVRRRYVDIILFITITIYYTANADKTMMQM